MSNKENNLKKLNKGDISNVTGGWYVIDESDYGSPDPGDISAVYEQVGIYDDNGNRLGVVNNPGEADDILNKLDPARLERDKSDKSALAFLEFFYPEIY